MPKPILYQLLPRLWGNDCKDPVPGGSLSRNGCGKFSSIDAACLEYFRKLGVTHLWYTGVIRHATTEPFEGCPASNPCIVKGRAGSPYALVDYYDVNPYLADVQSERMAEFEGLVKRTHAAGLKVLIDFIPNHVSRDYGKVGLVRKDVRPFGADDDDAAIWKAENDFFYCPGRSLELPSRTGWTGAPYLETPARASGNCFSSAPGPDDWYETVRLNYGEERTGTWDKMYDILRYWCGKGVDGFRCDMVEMVPRQFLKWLIGRIKDEFPEVVFLGEVYRRDCYSGYIRDVGFDFLYDKSGLYDVLLEILREGASARKISWNWQFLGDLQPRMLNFLENHDEPRFACDDLAGDASRSYAALGASLLFNTCPFMVYAGGEVGERGMDQEGFSGRDGRTSIFDWWSPGSLRRLRRHIHTGEGLTERERRVLERYSRALGLAAEPPVAEGGTFDLCYCNLDSEGFDPDRHFVFLRACGSGALLVFCNFSEQACTVRVKIPAEAFSCLGIPQTEAFNATEPVELTCPPLDFRLLRRSAR